MRNKTIGAVAAVLTAFLGVAWAAAPRFSNVHGAPAEVRYHGFFVAPPGANTNVIGTSVQAAGGISPTVEGSAFRVTVVLTTASVFNITATDGTNTGTWGLDKSVALQAGDLYTYTFATDVDLRYDFQVETDGTLEFLGVQEVIQEGL